MATVKAEIRDLTRDEAIILMVESNLQRSTILPSEKAFSYLIPDLIPPESPQVGKYGMLRRSYLQQWRNGLYTGMLLSGKLNQHLEEIDRQASEMMDRLTKQYAQEDGLTESLKAQNQLLWVQRMENCRSRAEETIMKDLIYS